MDNNIFTAIDEDGKELTYKMLYCKNVLDKHIIWYTDGSKDEEGRNNIFISSFKEQGNIFLLDKIEDKEELNKYIDILKKDCQE